MMDKVMNIFDNALSKLKSVYEVSRSSWKIKSVIAFIFIVFVLNVLLISQEHFTIQPTSTGSIIGNSFYLTTTQLSTIGYGDIIPVTLLAKLLTSIVHVAVIFITFSIAEEFGALSVASKQSEERQMMFANNELLSELLRKRSMRSFQKNI